MPADHARKVRVVDMVDNEIISAVEGTAAGMEEWLGWGQVMVAAGSVNSSMADPCHHWRHSQDTLLLSSGVWVKSDAKEPTDSKTACSKKVDGTYILVSERASVQMKRD